jgi:pyrroline-5-carboxylate reductase
MQNPKSRILVIGKNGKLGSRIFSRMEGSRRFRKQFEVTGAGREDNVAALAKAAAVIIVSVRPDQLAQLALTLGDQLAPGQLLISVVTGVTGQVLRDVFETTAIVCATTNIGVEIGKGSTVCCAPFRLSGRHKRLVQMIFGNWGKVHWQKTEESLPGSVIATGCMPAIHALDIEHSIQACVSFGMAEPLATDLVLGALEATLALYRGNKSGTGLIVVKKGVTTPGGITEQILAQLSKLKEEKNAAFATALQRIMNLQK